MSVRVVRIEGEHALEVRHGGIELPSGRQDQAMGVDQARVFRVELDGRRQIGERLRRLAFHDAHCRAQHQHLAQLRFERGCPVEHGERLVEPALLRQRVGLGDELLRTGRALRRRADEGLLPAGRSRCGGARCRR
jgi:hypothetical protein